jgi:hypothetical protein
MKNLRLIATVVLCSVFAHVPDGDATRKRKRRRKPAPKPPVVQPTPIPGQPVDTSLLSNSGLKVMVNGVTEKIVYCLETVPGIVDDSQGSSLFQALTEKMLLPKPAATPTPTNKKKKRKKRKKRRKNRDGNTAVDPAITSLVSQARERCSNPDFASLEAYRGQFTDKEARTLLNRFTFGASPEEIQKAVTDGLDVTVSRLLTVIPETQLGPVNLDNLVADIACDTYQFGDEQNDVDACALGNENDIEPDGVRLGFYARILHSPNGFYNKLFFFLHDERMAVAITAAPYYERYSITRHIDMIRRASFSGDYKQFMREWNQDLLGNLRWLDGALNKGASPNENYAREFWELGTTGPTDLQGAPVYTDLDLAQAALAFSGWTVKQDDALDSKGQEYRKDVAAYAPDLHAPGEFTIFAGTPYQAKVRTSDDVLEATFKHPRTSEHLAEDIWKTFINPFPTEAGILALAQSIRDNNFNLIPVFRKVMLSRALYSDRSYKSLIKHPMDLVFGLIKTLPTYPIPYWRTVLWHIDWYLENMGQRPLLPPTVFGWDEKQLAGEGFILGWRNAVVNLLSRGVNYYEEKEFDFKNVLLKDVATPQLAIAKYAKLFDVTLSDVQKAQLEQFMNYHRKRCWTGNTAVECRAGLTHFVEREIFDGNPANNDYESGLYKIQGLMSILLMMPEYRMK